MILVPEGDLVDVDGTRVRTRLVGVGTRVDLVDVAGLVDVVCLVDVGITVEVGVAQNLFFVTVDVVVIKLVFATVGSGHAPQPTYCVHLLDSWVAMGPSERKVEILLTGH